MNEEFHPSLNFAEMGERALLFLSKNTVPKA